MFEITFSNNYCGCDIVEEFEGTFEEANTWANERLRDYAEEYSYAIHGWDEDYSEEEFEEYFENCTYAIEEVKKIKKNA